MSTVKHEFPKGYRVCRMLLHELFSKLTTSTSLSRPRPILKDLHWLPVRDSVDYKIAAPCYKAVTTSVSYFVYSCEWVACSEVI